MVALAVGASAAINRALKPKPAAKTATAVNKKNRRMLVPPRVGCQAGARAVPLVLIVRGRPDWRQCNFILSPWEGEGIRRLLRQPLRPHPRTIRRNQSFQRRFVLP